MSGNIATKAVTADKIANGAVTADKIGNGAVTSEKIGPASVTSIKVDNNAITVFHLGDNAVETIKIKDGAVTKDKISTLAVATDKIKDKAVTSEKLADQLTFVETPKYPMRIYRRTNVTEGGSYDITSAQEGTIFSTAGTHTIELAMHFSDADNRFQAGDTYRVHNNTPNEIRVRDWTIDKTFTKIPAWTFKDFYYRGNAWDLT